MQPNPAEHSNVVLIVDDVLENLAPLSDALDEAGYMVIVATSGASAIERLERIIPDIILLDALMPGLDGFETCRRIKASPSTRRIPIIFMTGLTETEHVVQGFMAGGTDYVTKPIRLEEVLARIGAHVRNAHMSRQAHAVIDGLGFGVVVFDRAGKPNWMTVNTKTWLMKLEAEADCDLTEALGAWVMRQTKASAAAKPVRTMRVPLRGDNRRLTARYLGNIGGDEHLLLLQEQNDADLAASLLSSYDLTPREVEVLMWVAKGKTNKDIGSILGMSPRTVNKHLEHVYVKLGVETRAAATALAASARVSATPGDSAA